MATEEPAWVLTVATIALALFTAALVWSTLMLVEATRGLARLERERERRERLERKVRLAEAVIAIRPDASRDALAGGSVTSGAAELRELIPLFDAGKDVAREDLDYLSQTLDSAAGGTVYPSPVLVFDRLKHLQEQLRGALLPRWRAESRTIWRANA